MTNKFGLILLLLGFGLTSTGSRAEEPPREIAFSFDDAPAPSTYFTGDERTYLLLKALKKAKVDQAVFYAIGNRLSPTGQRRLEAYARGGHLIANHSQTHQRPEVLGVQGYLMDLDQAHEALSGMLGFRRWFRFPFLDEGKTAEIRDGIREGLDQRGYLNGHVTVDNFDFYMNDRFQRGMRKRTGSKKTASQLRTLTESLRKAYVRILVDCAEFYDALAEKGLGRSPKHVMLLHENDLAALYFSDLVKELRARNWKTISISEAYTDPFTHSKPNVIPAGQSLVAALAREKGVQGPLYHMSESVEFIDAEFKKIGW